MALCLVAGLCPLFVLMLTLDAVAQENFKETRSRSQYVHHIKIYDADGLEVDPSDPNAKPYSPKKTCMKCHDYKSIAHGYHFSAAQKAAEHGRPGEPWVWVDGRTGSQIPLSYRGWPGTYKPQDLGMSRFRFLNQFARHMPGGGVGEEPPGLIGPKEAAKPGDDSKLGTAIDAALTETVQPPADPDEARFKVSGNLEIDCMLCHSAGRSYSHEKWMKQIEYQNFAWAATAGVGLANIKGAAKSLPDDFDAKATPEKAVKSHYKKYKFDHENQVFFDIVRTPSNNSCYACHTTRMVREGSKPKWTYDEDVHVRAGIGCADCHSNGISHHTVRGFEGEQHPTGQPVESLSCRGCHYDEEGDDGSVKLGGRFGAPKPLHENIPPIHFEKMSCTTCHSGPSPKMNTQWVQTAMAHSLGRATQSRKDTDMPNISTPVFIKGEDGVTYPHRMMWPAYWGWMKGDEVTPMDPISANRTLRRATRVLRDFRIEMVKVRLSTADKEAALGKDRAKVSSKEWTEDEQKKIDALTRTKGLEEFEKKLAKGFELLAKGNKEDGRVPIYVAAGKAWRLNAKGEKAEEFEHKAAEPYAWPFAHDVRPARQSLGAKSCIECHATDSLIWNSEIVGDIPVNGAAASTKSMGDYQPDDAPVYVAMTNMAFKFLIIGTMAGLLLHIAGDLFRRALNQISGKGP